LRRRRRRQPLRQPALLAAVEEKRPRLVVFGHIHEAWGCVSQVGATPLRNLGPSGTWIEI